MLVTSYSVSHCHRQDAAYSCLYVCANQAQGMNGWKNQQSEIRGLFQAPQASHGHRRPRRSTRHLQKYMICVGDGYPEGGGVQWKWQIVNTHRPSARHSRVEPETSRHCCGPHQTSRSKRCGRPTGLARLIYSTDLTGPRPALPSETCSPSSTLTLPPSTAHHRMLSTTNSNRLGGHPLEPDSEGQWPVLRGPRHQPPCTEPAAHTDSLYRSIRASTPHTAAAATTANARPRHTSTMALTVAAAAPRRAATTDRRHRPQPTSPNQTRCAEVASG